MAKRILLVVLGYFAGLAAGAAALPGFLLLISTFNRDSQLWQFLGLGPIAVIVAPVILLTGFMLMPDWFSGMTLDRWLLTLAIALSALIGGVVHWAVAGRMAGFRREVSLPLMPS